MSGILFGFTVEPTGEMNTVLTQFESELGVCKHYPLLSSNQNY